MKELFLPPSNTLWKEERVPSTLAKTRVFLLGQGTIVTEILLHRPSNNRVFGFEKAHHPILFRGLVETLTESLDVCADRHLAGTLAEQDLLGVQAALK